MEPASGADFAINNDDKTKDNDHELDPLAKLAHVRARLAEEANGVRDPCMGLDAVASVANGLLLSSARSLGTFCSNSSETHKEAEERFRRRLSDIHPVGFVCFKAVSFCQFDAG